MPAEALPEIYTPEYYRRLHQMETEHWWHIGMRDIAAALLESQDGGTGRDALLDAGCGTGATLTWAQQRLGVRSAVGIDVSPDALAFCRSRGCDQVALASVLDLPFPDQRFGLVLCWDVLQHLPTNGGDVVALREMRRVLRPGGHVVLRANSRLGMWQAKGAEDEDYLRYTLAELVARVREAGLEPLRETYANVAPALHASALRWLRRRGRAQAGGRVYEGLTIRNTAREAPRINRCLSRYIAAEAHLLRTARRAFRFGHTTFCVARRPLQG